MASVTWNGTTYSIPEVGQLNWANLSNFLVDLGNNAAVAQEAEQAIRVATSTPVTVAAATDYAVITDLTVPAAVAVNLPVGVNGQIFVIVDGEGDAATNNITITPNGAETIRGAATLVLSNNRAGVALQYHASTTDWKILWLSVSPGQIKASDIADGSVSNTEYQYLANVTSDIQTQFSNKQPLDATLTAVAAYNTNGLFTQTAADTFTGRTITAGSSKIAVTDGNGVAGNPTIDVTEANLTLGNIGGTLGISKGGTGQTTQTAAFDALAPTTTKGDLIASDGSDNVRVAVGANGLVLTADSGAASGVSWSAVSPSLDSNFDEINLSLASSVGSSALTVALKDKAGSDPTGGSPVKIAFRSSTATTGTYNTRTVSAALSVVVSSGSTLGHVASEEYPIYVYALDNSGTVELAVSTTLFDTLKLQSTTAEGGAGAADSGTVLYSTTARSNVPIRLLGRLLSTQTTAGTWAAVPTTTSSFPDVIGPATSTTAGLVRTDRILSKSASYTITDVDGVGLLLMTIGSSTLTVTLPDATNNIGRKITIKKVDSGTGKVTVSRAGSDTIDGYTATDIGKGAENQYSYITLQASSAAWSVIAVSEVVTSTVTSGSAVAFGDSTFVTVTTVALASGRWAIDGIGHMNHTGGGAVSQNTLLARFTSTGTLGGSGGWGLGNISTVSVDSTIPTFGVVLPPVFATVTGTSDTITLEILKIGSNTVTAFGHIRAVRVR